MSDAQNSDQAFIGLLTEIVVRNLKDENFGIRNLAREAGLSTSTLNRRLNRIAGKSGNQFIRGIRLQKAHEMLQYKSVNVSEVSYAVGFSSPAYFSACFHEYYGYPPREVPKTGTSGLADENSTREKLSDSRKKSPVKSTRTYLTWILLFVLTVIGVIILASVKYFSPPSLDDLRSSDGRISVAIMPFVNLTGNRTWNCVQTNLIGYLSRFDELTVRQKEVVDLLLTEKGVPERASITPPVASSISRKLDSKVYISGVISQAGNRSRINVNLVNSKTREVIKSFQVEGESDNHRIYGMIDSVSVFVKNFLVTAKMVRETNPDLRPYSFTNSPEAFEYFVKADEAQQKGDIRTSLSLYLKTVEADSGFIPAMIFLSMRYGDLGDYAEAKKWCLRAYAIKDQTCLKDRHLIEWYHAVLFGTPEEEVRFLRQYVTVDDNVPIAYWQMGNAYVRLQQYTNAIPEFEMTLKLYKKWNVRPMMIQNYTTLINACISTQQYKKANKMLRIAAKTFPEESWMLLKYRALLAYAKGDATRGGRYTEEYLSAMEERSGQASIIYPEIASLYAVSGNIAKAEKILREANSRHPDDPAIKNSLAYLLIDRDVDIREGLRIAEEGLKIKPDDYGLLHTLGWGLARMGRYDEAFEVLNKSWNLRPEYDQTLHQQISEVQKKLSTLN